MLYIYIKQQKNKYFNSNNHRLKERNHIYIYI